MVQANSFGLGPKFLLEKKRNSMDPRESKATKLEMMPQVQPSELHEKFEEWIDPRYIVIFTEDGVELKNAKSFKFNLLDIMTKYESKVKKEDN